MLVTRSATRLLGSVERGPLAKNGGELDAVQIGARTEAHMATIQRLGRDLARVRVVARRMPREPRGHSARTPR